MEVIMKSKMFLGMVLAAFALFSCQNPVIDDTDDLAAVEVAESVSNEQTGATQELSENLSFALPEAQSVSGSQIVITGDASFDPSFVWDPAGEYYVRSGSNLSVVTARYTGNISTFRVTLQFLDAEGNSLQSDAGHKMPAGTVSLKLTRSLNGTMTRILTGVTRNITLEAQYTVTGLNQGNDYAILNGLRTVNVSVKKGLRTGSWTVQKKLIDVKVRREKLDDNTRYLSLEGYAEIHFEGEYSGPRGSRSVTKDAQVYFKRERTVSVTVDGNTVVIDIVKG
jgi:hypothetical protein